MFRLNGILNTKCCFLASPLNYFFAERQLDVPSENSILETFRVV